MIGRIAMVRNRRMAGYHHHNSSFHETCIDDDSMIPAANSGGSIFSPSNIIKMDHGSLLAAFKHHWSQAYSVMNAKTPSSGFNPIKVPKNQIVCHNDVVNIANHIDQMTALLSRCFNQAGRKHSTSSNSSHDRIDNFRRNSDTNPLLDYLINESILEKIFTWSCEIGEYSNIMKVEQLKLYEIILCSTCHSHAHDQTFCDKVISPLHKFLDTCRNTCPLEVEKRLVRLLNSLCTAIRNNDSRLLKLFFPETIEQKQQQINSDNNSELSIGHSSQLHLPENGRFDCESRFLIFSLLLSFVHREGIIGQQARNGILQIIPLSTTNESLSNYVAFDSNLAPVMTTILSGLYSSLPRKLTKSDDHPQISDEDIQRISEIRIFVTCLDFCNSIVQASHPAIEQQMMSLIYQGFLVPVIGPALHEETVQQIITTTAYLELCLRCITDPSLMKIFLKFICIESFDEQRILHTLISRIQASTKLSSISLTLFRTMINLNCEDVMIELIFKHLRNFNQVLSQSSGQIARNEIQDYKSSAQFLSLLPNFSLHSSISSPNSAKLPSQNVRGRRLLSETSIDFTHSYLRYLDDARASIILTKNATKKWAHRNESRNDGTNEKSARGINSPVDSGISTQNSLSNHDDIDGQKSMHDDKSSQSFAIASSTSLCNEAEMIGPFLSNLFSRLSQLPYNDYQLNLIITGLISKLASFSDESLRSLLLDCDLKMHKNVRNLFSVMSHLKRQIEDLAKEVENFHSLLNQTRSAMFSNEFSESIPTPGKSIPGEFKEKRRSGFLSLLSWGSKSNSNSPKSDPKEFTSLESFNDGYKFINRRGASPEEDESEIAKKMFHNQRVVHAAILFEEFVKEMAAIAQEHETLGNYKISL